MVIKNSKISMKELLFRDQERIGQISADVLTYMAGMITDKERIAVEVTFLSQLKSLSFVEQRRVTTQLFYRFEKIILENKDKEDLYKELQDSFDQKVLSVLHIPELGREIVQTAQDVHLGKMFSGLGLQELMQEGSICDVPASLIGKDNVNIPVVISGSLLKDKKGVASGVVLVSKDLRQLKVYAKRRLSAITPVLQKVAAGDFSSRLFVPRGEDEFTEHVTVLNRMLTNLKSMAEEAKHKSEELEKQNDELKEASKRLEETKMSLEDKVQVRTQELQDAKSGLENLVIDRTKELQELNRHLGQEVTHRTQELQKRLLELERFNRVAVGRELKMIELKEEIKKMHTQINQPITTTE